MPFGEATVLKFEKRVKSYSTHPNYTIRPEDEGHPDYTTLIVIPRFTSGSGKVRFFLENNKVVRVLFKTFKNESGSFLEMSYHLKAKPYVNTSKAPPIRELELLRAMVRNNIVSNYKKKTYNKKMKSGHLGVTSKLVHIYEGENLNGYVFKLTNQLRHNRVKIDVRRIRVGKPNLALISQSDQQYIYPKSKGIQSTYVRIVAKPSSYYRNIKLPITTERLGGGP